MHRARPAALRDFGPANDRSGSRAAKLTLSITRRVYPRKPTSAKRTCTSVPCRFCCKSLFVLVTQNSPGRRREFRVKMWGTSSPNDKLVSDLGNPTEATRVGDRRLNRPGAEKLSPANFGLLQQNLPEPDICD